MASTPKQALDRLLDFNVSGELERFCEEHGVGLLVAFGSAVDPERVATARDLDLAISWTPDSARDLFGLISALMRLLCFNDIDVLELDRAQPVAVEQALVGTRPLYESEAGTLVELRERAMMRRMDTAWLRHLDLRLMAAGDAARA